MTGEWKEVFEGGGVHVHTYLFEKFGPANALLLEYKENQCAILSPPPAPDPQLVDQARSKGDVNALIISNLGHTAGYRDWRQIFPEARIYASSECIPLLERMKLEETFYPISELPVRAEIEFIEAPGTRTGSLLLRSQLAERSVVFVDEVLINLQEPVKPLFIRLMFFITGTRTGLCRNNVYWRFLTTDRRQLADAILSLLENDPVCIPAHGELITETEQLRRARAILV